MNDNLDPITGEVETHEQFPNMSHEVPQLDNNQPSLSGVWNQLPMREPVLIQNTLRRYQKMMITGPSKSCKTALAIQLAIAVAEGIPWLENECVEGSEGNVLYLNFDESIATIYSRFFETYQALGVEPKKISNITILNLKGEMTAENEDDFINRVLALVNGFPYRMMIIDSIDYLFDIGDSGTAIRLNQAIDRFMNKAGNCTVLVHSDVQQETKLSDLSECVVRLIPSESRKDSFRIAIDSNSFKAPTADKIIDYHYPSIEYRGLYNRSLDLTNKIRHEKANYELNKAFNELSSRGDAVHVNDLAAYLKIARETVYKKIKNSNVFQVNVGIVERINNP